jgi:integrase
MKDDALPTRYPQRMKFTEDSVKALKRDPARVEYVVWNSEMPCFGVRLRGDRKIYIDQPRVHGRSVKNTIGDVSKISLKNATKIARKHFAEARLGILGADKAKANAEAAEAKLTLARVAEQYLKAKEGVLSDGTHAAATRYFEKHWGPLLSLPLNRIQRRNVAERLRELIDQHGRSSASHARTNLSALFRWSMGEGLCDINPVIGTNDPEAGTTPRQCVLEDEAIKAIWDACLDDGFGKIVKLLLLTGCRRDEIGALRWDEVNLKTGMLIIHEGRVKNRHALRLPLPAAALDILGTIPRRDGPCVFGNPGHGFTGWSAAKTKLDARLADVLLPDWRIHDLRRSMRTGLGRLGIPPHIAELAINHVKKGVLADYDHYSYEPEIAKALVQWAEHVIAVVEGRKSKVVPLRSA